MNTYTYEIINLYTTDSGPDRPNDVARVLTAITATNEAGLEKTLNCMFNISPGESFIPFEQLTDEQVRQWVDASLQWPYYKKELDAMLNEQPVAQLNPQTLPWLPTQEQSISDFQTQNIGVTSSSNTATVINSMLANAPEEYIKSLVYQALYEIEANKV